MKFVVAALLALIATPASSLLCDQGAVPTQNNVCIVPDYIEGCWQYASQNACAQCNYNYDLEENGLCSYNPENSQPCCLNKDTNGKCSECNHGLSLINGICEQVQIIGCLQKNMNGRCLNCAKGFSLNDGKCQKAIKNCLAYSSDKSICFECENNYSLVSNNCLKNKILGCKKEQFNSCTECYQPFELSSGHCSIDNCKSYSDFGCVACECGYYITKDRICLKIEEGCIRHQKGVCTDCYPPFQLQGASCVLDGCRKMSGLHCDECMPEYQNENGICKIPNCLDGANGHCKICKAGYNYHKGICMKSSQKVVFGSY